MLDIFIIAQIYPSSHKQKTPLLRGLMFYWVKNLFQQYHLPGLQVFV